MPSTSTPDPTAVPALRTVGAYSVRQFLELFPLSRSTLYGEIRAGRLELCKINKRSLIPCDSAERWWQEIRAGKRDPLATFRAPVAVSAPKRKRARQS